MYCSERYYYITFYAPFTLVYILSRFIALVVHWKLLFYDSLFQTTECMGYWLICQSEWILETSRVIEFVAGCGYSVYFNCPAPIRRYADVIILVIINDYIIVRWVCTDTWISKNRLPIATDLNIHYKYTLHIVYIYIGTGKFYSYNIST